MKGHFDTFVVRILSENEGKFKGNVQHLRTQDKIHFDKFEDMDKFILSHTIPEVQTAAENKTDLNPSPQDSSSASRPSPE
jgi:hypothetical protein